MTTTQLNEEAEARLLNAQRTGCQDAVRRAQAFNQFRASQVSAAAASRYEAARQQELGAAGRYHESVGGNYGHTL